MFKAILLLAAVVVSTLAASTPNCGRNEFFDPCTGCESTCRNTVIFCPLDCENPGRCRCIEGYVRNDNGTCIPQDECHIECPEGEHFSNCGGCDGTCDMPQVPCPAICQLGRCVCDYGYVRSVEGKCIHINTCVYENNPCLTTQCKKGQTCLTEATKCNKSSCPKKARCIENECIKESLLD